MNAFSVLYGVLLFHHLLTRRKSDVRFRRVIDETVRAARKFLEEHPEEMKIEKQGRAQQGFPGTAVIAHFLGWPESRVSYALERLGLVERGRPC